MACTSRSTSFNTTPKSTPLTCHPNPSILLIKPSQFHSFRSRNFRVTWKRQRGLSLVPVIRTSIDLPMVRPGGIVESDRLPSGVRNQTMDALDACGGYRVTVGDVSSKAGINLTEAQKALQALAADTNGLLEVSDEGDVLYVFRSDYRSVLATKSLGLKLQPMVNKAKSIAEYIVRVSFGTTLLASIVLASSAIIVILVFGAVASLTEGGGGDVGDASWFFTGAGHILDLSNPSFFYWDPPSHNMRHQQTDPRSGVRIENHQRMSFLESVFSFVFGDHGDLGQGSEEERWKLIGQYIASNGGVVTGEELAPYLDIEFTGKKMVDESFVLPVLLRFDGQPEVDEEGNILYRFPSLQRTAGIEEHGVGGVENEKLFTEKKRQFSNTSKLARVRVIGLGALNLLAVLCLGTMLKSLTATTIPSRFISFVSAIFPLMQIYAASFFVVPLVRWFFTWKTNAEIEKRNRVRQECARALQSPDFSLRMKLLNARAMSQRTFIGHDRIVYSTETDLVEQGYEKEEWDWRFNQDIGKSG